MLKIILIVIVVLIAALLALAATRPSNFRVLRKASIKAPPEKIFPLIGIFVNMDKMIGNDFEAGLANLKTVAEK